MSGSKKEEKKEKEQTKDKKESCWEKYFLKYWYLLVPVAFYIFVLLKSLFSENGSGTDKNEDMSENDLKIIKKNTIESEFKAIIGIDFRIYNIRLQYNKRTL